MTKTVLITGCSSGIGAAAARAFAGADFAVWATMRNPTSDAGRDLAQVSGVTVDRLDVTDPASIQASVEALVARHGRIDVVVNNAGQGLLGPFEPQTPAQVEGQFVTNALGPINVTRAVLPTLRRQGGGVIVNVTSIGGLTTMPLNAVYHATKYAVDGFSEALRYELDPLGVTVKVVAPGGVATAFGATASQSLATTDPGAYADTLGKVVATFRNRAGGVYSTPEAIAEVILEAATDGKPQMRYVAGADAEALLAMRAELNDDVAYISAMKARFGLA